LEAAAPEPIFIEELPALTFQPADSATEPTTMIFRAPLEIAEPVWKDETVPSPTAPEPVGSVAPEPQLEHADSLASSGIPEEQSPVPAPISVPVTATSLDSFSLEDATAGQVHFASGAAEFAPVQVAPMETAPVEAAPVEVAPVEAAPTEVAAVEAAQSAPAEEVPATEIAPPGPAPEAAITETALPEAPLEAAPPETRAEVAAFPPALDWGLVYSVVHKVVVRMSPPPVPREVVEEMARRLADEIAAEMSSESSQPQG
jgi:ribonuclease E